jgi:hypothetical protein
MPTPIGPLPWRPFDWPDDETEPGDFTPMPWTPHTIDLATWVTKGTNCPACNVLKGRTYPFGYWIATVMPGWHKGCDCRLVRSKSGVRESPHDLWGTEPLWWNPTLTLGQYLSQMLQRFLDYFNGRAEWWKLDGDAYSGFDNLYPLFMSQNGITSAQWTIMDYKIRVQGFVSANASYSSLLDTNKVVSNVCLPWETSNRALPNPKIDIIKSRNR